MSRAAERRLRRRKKDRYNTGEDLNPMNFVSNLSDVMLILAVGIMLALVLHWNVNIAPEETPEEESRAADTIQFNEDDLENKEALPENAEKMGNVYYDPDTDSYYIIKEQGDGSSVPGNERGN